MQDKMIIKENENILKELCNPSDIREKTINSEINRVPENPLYQEHEEDQDECFLFFRMSVSLVLFLLYS